MTLDEDRNKKEKRNERGRESQSLLAKGGGSLKLGGQWHNGTTPPKSFLQNSKTTP